MSPADTLLHWEDFAVGETVPIGATEVTREEIIEFAREFDPQPFHLDEDAARDSLLGGLAASGWHTCAMLMRMMCDGYLNRSAGQGGAGVEEVRWLKPVRPGDVLRSQRTCLDKRPSASRPGIGIVRMLLEVFNQRGETVMTWVSIQMFARRDGGGGAGEGA